MDSIIFYQKFQCFSIAHTANFIQTGIFSIFSLLIDFYKFRGDFFILSENTLTDVFSGRVVFR